MSTENIEKFLATAYSDEQLAALLAHAQDGKLSYRSCCCLIGVVTADHALKGEYPKVFAGWADGASIHHIFEARNQWEFAPQAESEFARLGRDDAERRERLIPLIYAEMERRTWASIASKLPDLPLEEQHRLEEINAEAEGDWAESHLRAHFGNAGER
jgi:hypothetical protein